MKTNVVVKTKIRVNGKEYASTQEMPPQIRAAYERALASLGSHAAHPSVGTASSHAQSDTPVASTITLNGQTYGSSDEMPAEVRALYNDAIATLTHENVVSDASHRIATTVGTDPSGGPSGSSIQPQSVGSRLMIVLAAILVLALLAFGRMAVAP